MNVGEDGLNRSTRINTRIKRKLTFLQVSWITRKLKRTLWRIVFSFAAEGSSLINYQILNPNY